MCMFEGWVRGQNNSGLTVFVKEQAFSRANRLLRYPKIYLQTHFYKLLVQYDVNIFVISIETLIKEILLPAFIMRNNKGITQIILYKKSIEFNLFI